MIRFRDDVDALTLRKRGIVARMPIAPQVQHQPGKVPEHVYTFQTGSKP
jgi:hypothetical protein